MALSTTTKKMGDRNIGCQLLRGALLVLVLVPTILVWVAVGTAFFGGYRVVSTHGTSMEPALRDRDAIWVKPLGIADVKVGDIVTLVLPVGDIIDPMTPGEEAIAHRVVKIEPLSKGSYSLTTKGDANHFTEEWQIGADWTIEVMVARVPFAGYVVDFLTSIFGMALVSSVLVTLYIIWVRRRRMTRGSG